MTDEQINAAIHAALGNPVGCPRCSEPECDYNSGLNYCTDLNAMHEVEKALEEKRNHYIDTLGMMYKDSWEFATATARQRAEAFLRTLDKWEEDK
jgi:hypothetical protein